MHSAGSPTSLCLIRSYFKYILFQGGATHYEILCIMTLCIIRISTVLRCTCTKASWLIRNESSSKMIKCRHQELNRYNDESGQCRQDKRRTNGYNVEFSTFSSATQKGLLGQGTYTPQDCGPQGTNQLLFPPFHPAPLPPIPPTPKFPNAPPVGPALIGPSSGLLALPNDVLWV